MNVTMEEATRSLATLIHKSAPGDEIFLIENNLAVEKLVSLPKPPRKAGSAKGKIQYMADDFNETPVRFEEYAPSFISEVM